MSFVVPCVDGRRMRKKKKKDERSEDTTGILLFRDVSNISLRPPVSFFAEETALHFVLCFVPALVFS